MNKKKKAINLGTIGTLVFIIIVMSIASANIY